MADSKPTRPKEARDELLNAEEFGSVVEAKVLAKE